MAEASHPLEAESEGSVPDSSSGLPSAGLTSRSFIGLLLTQFFGATNDNITRWLVIGVGKSITDKIDDNVILVVGSCCFILPYILLAAPAGYLADRFSKQNVIVWCKRAEVLIMSLVVLAAHLRSPLLLLIAVATMGAQSALFGPSKLGSIPEMLHPRFISAANGLLGFVTVVAIVVGTALGNWLAATSVAHTFGSYDSVMQAIVLVGFALAGLWTSGFIISSKAAQPGMPFPRDFIQRTFGDLKILSSDRALLMVALGSMFFWSLGALSQLNIDQFVDEQGGTNQAQVTPALISLVLGLALGSVLAGLWSNEHVELGILPLAASGLVLFTFLLFTVRGDLIVVDGIESHYTGSYIWACFFLAMVGFNSGLFEVPLAAYLQHRSPPESRGAILAAANFLVFLGMFISTLLFLLLRNRWMTGEPLFSARQVFLFCSLCTLPVVVLIVLLIPQSTAKSLAWILAHTGYRIRLHQRDNLPSEGGALLVANHVTWADGILMLSSSSRPIRLMIKDELLNSRWRRWGARLLGMIAVPSTPKGAGAAMEVAREALQAGQLVCLFAEGRITRSGQLQSFSRGVLSIVRGTGAPIIPVYLDELWGSMFSYRGGKPMGRWPFRWPRRVSIWFGEGIAQPRSVGQVREAVQWLGAKAAVSRHQSSTNVARTMLRNCRKARFRWKIADSTGQNLTGSQVLMRVLGLRRLLLRTVLGPVDQEQYVGVLVPPSAGAVITNAAVTLAGRVAVNLNYSVTEDVLNACIRQAGIRHILASRKLVEKLDMKLDAEVVYLEDFRDKITLSDKLYALFHAHITPTFLLDRMFGLHKVSPDQTLTVIFTSGSTGEPKGVMLSYRNVASNVEAVDQVIQLRPDDTILGILPFFHSFGYTITLWGALALDIHAAFHFSPLDAKQVGSLTKKSKATILLTTPTFLRGFIKRCSVEEFATLDVVVAGAEKLPSSLCDAFEQKFGIRPIEGYGATELSPLVSVNVPPSRSHHEEVDNKEGTVGRPVPGVAAKVVDPETLADLPQGESGMLLVTGPNVMKGYLDRPDKTAEVIHNGWYVTGDIARIDADGFIQITGRESRFSKIGGEMVPHLRVEELVQEVLGIADDHEEPVVVVAGIPDPRKGERLVVIHRPIELTPAQVVEGLQAKGIPNLWIPGADSFLEVDEIPVLGSGKLDLKGITLVAKERFASSNGSATDSED